MAHIAYSVSNACIKISWLYGEDILQAICIKVVVQKDKIRAMSTSVYIFQHLK